MSYEDSLDTGVGYWERYDAEVVARFWKLMAKSSSKVLPLEEESEEEVLDLDEEMQDEPEVASEQ